MLLYSHYYYYISVPYLYNVDQTKPDLRPTLCSYTTCVGNEDRLADCFKNPRLNGHWYGNSRPAVRCFDGMKHHLFMYYE